MKCYITSKHDSILNSILGAKDCKRCHHLIIPKKTKQNCDQGVLPSILRGADVHFRDVRMGKIMHLGADDI